MHARPTILILVALAGSAYAQSVTTGAVEGRVLDKKTKEPLAGVTVVATGATPEPQNALTDADGAYKITDLLPGDYAITFYVDQLVVTRRGIHVGANDAFDEHEDQQQANARRGVEGRRALPLKEENVASPMDARILSALAS